MRRREARGQWCLTVARGGAMVRGVRDVLAEPTPSESTASPPAPPGPWAFRLLCAGSVFNQAAFWMQQVSMGWLVLELTNSPLQLGLTSFLRGLPMLVLSPFAGVLVDRLDRRRLALGAQSVLAAGTLLLTLLIMSHWVQAWHAFLFAFVAGIAVSVSFPARQAMIPNVVPRAELGRAVATIAAGQNGARVIAPGFAGLLISVSGLATCFGAQATAFLASVLTTWGLPTPPMHRTDTTGVVATMLAGFQHIWTSPSLRGLMILAVVPTVLALPYQQLLPVFARDVYQVGPAGLGLLLTANSTGAFLGAVLATALMGGHGGWSGLCPPRGLVLLLSGVIVGLGLVLLAAAPSFPVGLIVLLLTGGAFSVYNATNNALLHEATTDAFRGRVMSIYLMTWSLMPLGTLPAGALADRVGAPLTVAAGGALCALLVSAVWLSRPVLRQLR
ncbi:MAG TPA: MFS transporter [Chloroflexota bacterium]|nr:MFS transporter [Chloroflexota bacterium]